MQNAHMRVQAPLAPGFKGFRRFKGWRLTGLRPEGCGRLMAAGCVRFAQGATAPAALRVVDCPSGNAYKVSVTGFTFSVIWHDRNSGD